MTHSETRKELIRIVTENEIRRYGKDSATVKSEFFHEHIKTFVDSILK